MRKTHLATLAAAAATALSLGLAGCGSGGGTSGTGDSSTLTFAIANDPLNLNPAGVGSGNDTAYVTRQVYDSLVYQDPKTLKIEPWLAKSFSANKQATAFTFKLRDDVTFSDGTKLTATTVKKNLDGIKAAGAQSGAAANLADYSGTRVKDAHTAVVTFSKPNAAFLSEAAGTPLALISDKSLGVPFAQRAKGTNISGSGPFTIGSYAKDQETDLKKRDGYAWAPASTGASGTAKLDGVKFTVVPESGNRTGGLSSGQTDVAGSIVPNDINTVSGSANLIERANPGNVFGVYFNEKADTVKDKTIREAVAYAVDAKKIQAGSLNEHFKVATSVLASTTNGYKDESSLIPKPDPEKAGQILDRAGWKKGSDGIRAKGGKKLKFRINYINNFAPNSDSIALLQQQLKAVGIDSTQVSGTVPEFQEVLAKGSYELSWQNLSSVDPDVLRTQFSSQGTKSFPVADSALNKRLIGQIQIGDPAKRLKAVAALQKELITGYHVVPVHELTTIVGAAKSVSGVRLGADSRLDTLVTASKG